MPKTRYKLTGFLLGLIFSCSALAAEADPVALNPAHPDRYTVVKEDTLWDIAGKFLQSPWRWPDVWHVNPQIANPHLIYPGDIIELVYIDGKPHLRMSRSKTVKLSPKVLTSALPPPIPTIPIDAIYPFLTQHNVIGEGELDDAPYVVDFATDHLVGSKGITIYVRAIETEEHSNFDIVRPGDPYKDAESGEILGYEALHIGGAELKRTGDPATLIPNRSEQEILVGDRLVASTHINPMTEFHPKAPDTQINGSIISVLNGVTQIGQHNVVVLDRGSEDGLQPGDVLAVDNKGEVVPDHVTSAPRDTVTLPDEEAGILMVFRTFPRVSFGLILKASRSLHVLDRVRNPDP
jgi:hypothetical protein